MFEMFNVPAKSHTVQRLDLSAPDLTGYVAMFITERGHSFTAAAEREIVHRSAESSNKQQTYEFLPGNIVAHKDVNQLVDELLSSWFWTVIASTASVLLMPKS